MIAVTPAPVDIFFSRVTCLQMDAQGRTALVHSSNFGHTDVVKMLVQNGADVNLSDPTNRCSPIAAAAFSGHTEIVEQATPASITERFHWASGKCSHACCTAATHWCRL